MVRERRVRFLLEPAMATDASVADTDVEGTTPPKGPIQLCFNGRPPTTLPTEGPRPGELEELERHITAVRAKLHQALVRRGELLAQLPGGTHYRPLRLLQACGEAPEGLLVRSPPATSAGDGHALSQPAHLALHEGGLCRS